MSADPALSVVIPTFRRSGILRRCLEHLQRQTIAGELDVIIVSDGPDPDTKKTVEEGTWAISVRYFEIPKSQQGVARNRGAAEARAPYLLYIGDDIFLAPDACERHLAIHHSSPQPRAVLGFVQWDPSLDISPAMRWLDHTGWQFGYRLLEDHKKSVLPRHLQHRFTYTSFISLPAAAARAYPFREDLQLYGWEDILWGEELKDADFRLYYEPDARALHHHVITFEDSLKRMETLGKSLKRLEKDSPGFDRIPRGRKLILYRLFAKLPTMRGRHYRAFLRGLSQGKALA